MTAGLLFVSGCTSSAPGPCAAASVTLDVTVTDDAMAPSALAVCRGQDVTLEVHGQTDGVLHVHGYDEQVPATSLMPGETTTLAFTADVAGQFVIELHARSGGGEAEIGILTVNEP